MEIQIARSLIFKLQIHTVIQKLTSKYIQLYRNLLQNTYSYTGLYSNLLQNTYSYTETYFKYIQLYSNFLTIECYLLGPRDKFLQRTKEIITKNIPAYVYKIGISKNRKKLARIKILRKIVDVFPQNLLKLTCLFYIDLGFFVIFFQGIGVREDENRIQ